MKFTIALAFDVDPQSWASEYDLPSEKAAVEDIGRVFPDSKTWQDLIHRNWPMMRDQATITATGPVEAVLADGTDTNLAAFVDSLSEATRIRLKTALADHTHRSAHTRLVGYVRDAIATAEDIEPAAKPYAVIFDADEWDNGHFVCGRGDVVEADGQSVGGLRLADDVEAAITDAYGHVAPGAALAVRLSDGEVIFDDDKSFVYQELGLSFARDL